MIRLSLSPGLRLLPFPSHFFHMHVVVFYLSHSFTCVFLIVSTDLPEVQIHPTNDPYQSTPAALVYVAHFVEMIAWVLDQPLPFPLHRPEALRCAHFINVWLLWRLNQLFACDLVSEDVIQNIEVKIDFPYSLRAIAVQLHGFAVTTASLWRGREVSWAPWPSWMTTSCISASHRQVLTFPWWQ